MVLIAEHGSASRDTSDVARWADVAVIDYHLGDRDGLWLTRQIKQRPCPPPVLIYSAFADSALAVAAIVAGADGVLPKTTLAEELTIAIRRLVHRSQYFPAIPASITAALSSRLTALDQAIFSMLIHGVRPGEISTRLALSRRGMSAGRIISIASESDCIVGSLAPGSGQPAGPASSLDDDPLPTLSVSGEVRCVESISGPSDRFLFVIEEPSSGFYVLSTTNI